MRDFEESAHLSEDGTFDMYAIIKALYEDGFDGPIRPDHGRMIWGEKAMPGYGLYDRALMYYFASFSLIVHVIYLPEPFLLLFLFDFDV